MKEIQSTKNTIIKERNKLHKRKYREQENRYLLEGFHLVEEAVASSSTVEEIFLDSRGFKEWGEWATQQAAMCYLVSDEVMKHLSDLPTPQGMIATVQKVTENTMDLTGKWLLLDNVQDPGNVGTMIRTADAAGFDGVILGEGTADIYSTKVLRSMQGSQFHLPVFSANLLEVIPKLQANQVPVYGTELNVDAVTFTQLEKTNQVALILGNEGQGVTKNILEVTDKNIYIPIYGKAESLNVGVAAGILMYAFVQ
ncbi:RNA methyltransferase [Enterococcus saccharolyticus]|uniref:23S rRNA methyltransferase n=1 Tax=Candidatus Enterococcus willemsii TaxID=1857215 RepID=A0ABQ6YYZ2_9ENTE|nr:MULTISPECIES: RNA methyltransferase [Enterococcus]KAF1303487.1 23S rRNA methyltransferase [Enterococcus sp. CU12B]MCD5002674.1 RNA methyltransferase [Enterococcus saccharolyticus]